jgi:anti-sigma-K factor RskA
MNSRKLQDNDRLREHLGAGYVLGTLKGGARRRFEHWLAQDPVLVQSVSDWQNRLSPMAEFTPAVPPPARVWQGIKAHLDLDAAPRKRAQSQLFGSLAFWRGLSLVTSALAAVLLVFYMLQPPGPAGAPSTLALLAADNGQPIVAVTTDARQMTVRVIGPVPVTADRSLELWAIPAEGTPLSLGLLNANGAVTIRLPPHVTPQTMPVLAVSLEPRGGSPNPRAPSGPVLYKGTWIRI